MPSFSGKKTENVPIRTEQGVAYYKNLEFQEVLKFQLCYSMVLYAWLLW